MATVSTSGAAAAAHLTDRSGRTLYLFGADTGTASTCSGSCATEWIPLTTAGEPTVMGSAKSAQVGTISRAGGEQQVTYAGHPLYYFAGDSAPGQTKGEGLNDFGGVWSTVTPTGVATTTKAADGGSDKSPGDGYSYPY